MRNSLLFLSIFIISLPLFSEVTQITEEKAIELALDNNMALERQRINELNANIDNDSSYNAFYPKVQSNIAVSRSNSIKEDSMVVQAGPNLMLVDYEIPQTSLAFGFESSIYLTPAIVDGIKLLESNANLESLKTVKEERKVVKDTKKSFYTLILLQEQIKVYESNLKALENRYNQVFKNYNAGYVDELTLLEVEVALESLKPQINKLKQAYDLSIKNFKLILGIDINSDIEVTGSININEVELLKENILTETLLNNSDLSITKQNIELLDEQIALKKNIAFFPTLGISYSMQTALPDPFNTDMWDADNFIDDQGKFNIFLTMDFATLLPNSKERIEIQKLNNTKKAALLGQDELKKGIELKIIKHLQNLENSLLLQESLESTVKLANRKLKLTTQAYNQGTKELLEVETAENDLRKAQLDLLNEEYNYMISLFEIEEITGEEKWKKHY